MSEPAPIAVSMGEPAGIGPDLILQLYANRAELALPPFIVFGSMAFLAARARRLGLSINFAQTTVAQAAAEFPVALPVAHIDGLVPDKPGDTSPLSGKVVIEAISRAVAETLAGKCRAIVTAPIHKAALYTAGFRYPGHTEFLAALCGNGGPAPRAVMMLAHEGFRVVPLTIHVPLRDVPGLITGRLIRDTAQIVEHDLRTRFGIDEPRIAVTGLNPHAGVIGAIGTEENDIIVPAVVAARARQLRVEGPFPSDTVFPRAIGGAFDGVVTMFHDQGQIALKLIGLGQGITLLAGFPVPIATPGHGTAFDIAGTGQAKVEGLAAAVSLVARMMR